MSETIKGRLCTTAVFLAGFTAAVFLVNGNSSVAWIPTVFFSLLFLFSVLRDVDVTTGDVTIGMSSNTAIVGGAAVVFYTLNSPLGFILALLTTVIYPPNIKDHKWGYLIFNVSMDMLAGCAAYFSLHLMNFSIESNIFLVIFQVFVAVTVFEFVNYFINGIYSAIMNEPWRELLYDLKNSLIEVLPLAVFAGILGKFYFDYGSAMLLMFAVPLFLGRELTASYARMAETQKSAISTLITTLEAKDKYTAGHVERVAMFAKYIGEELGYGPKRLERLRQAALLHDVGKLVVPSALLNKPGKLTEDEFKIIQRHEFVTIEILRGIDFLSSIAITAGGDHNKMKDEKTRKLEPYIVSVCDAFDAMTSSRSYRKALPMEVAFEELHSKSGKQFHPKVAQALIDAIERRGEHYGAGFETDIVHEDAPEAGIGSAGIGDLEAGTTNTSSALSPQ